MIANMVFGNVLIIHSFQADVKGFGSGIGSVVIGLIVGEALPGWGDILKILLPGFVAYGLSIYFYVYAQRDLGAAKTSAYYAVAPFIGVLLKKTEDLTLAAKEHVY